MRELLIVAALATFAAAPARADEAVANAVYERMQASGATDPAALLEKMYAPD